MHRERPLILSIDFYVLIQLLPCVIVAWAWWLVPCTATTSVPESVVQQHELMAALNVLLMYLIPCIIAFRFALLMNLFAKFVFFVFAAPALAAGPLERLLSCTCKMVDAVSDCLRPTTTPEPGLLRACSQRVCAALEAIPGEDVGERVESTVDVVSSAVEGYEKAGPVGALRAGLGEWRQLRQEARRRRAEEKTTGWR